MSETREGEIIIGREKKLQPGEASLVTIEGRDGYRPNFSIVGMRDKDGRATYLPIFGEIVDGDGNPTGLAKRLGIDRFIGGGEISEEQRAELFASLYVMPPILAVDRVFNDDPEKDNLNEYTYSPDGLPTQLVGIKAPPRTGKTTYLATLVLATDGEEKSQSNVRVIDLDDFSPESLNKTVEWLKKEGYGGKTELDKVYGAIKNRFQALRESKAERASNQKVALRERLKKIRNNYKNEEQTHVLDKDGSLYKILWLVDLPGIAAGEERKLDLFDALGLTMPTVEITKAGKDLQLWELPLINDLVNKQMEREMRDFEKCLAGMELSLEGMTRMEVEELRMTAMV